MAWRMPSRYRRLYRRSLWTDAEDLRRDLVREGCARRAIYPVTAQYDVPLMVSRGFSSETFCYEAMAPEAMTATTMSTILATSTALARTPLLEEKLTRFAEKRI